MVNATRAYLFSLAAIRKAQSVLDRVGRVLSVPYEALWLGVFDTSGALNAVSRAHYARFGDRYTTEAWNRSGFMWWERDAVDRSFGSVRSAIVTSAGGGREALALAQRGLRVSAFECVPEFVAFARILLEGSSATIVEADPEEVPEVGVHDGAIVGWGSYMHIPGSEARVRFLRGLRKQIADGGPVLISCELRKPEGRRAAIVARAAGIVRRLHGSRQPVEIGDGLKGWYCHRFTEEQLRDELAQAGFRLDFCSDQGYGHAVAIAI
jgi:hypothetical protein